VYNYNPKITATVSGCVFYQVAAITHTQWHRLVTCQVLPTTAFMRDAYLRSVRKSHEIKHSIEHQAKMVKMSKLSWFMVSYKFKKWTSDDLQFCV